MSSDLQSTKLESLITFSNGRSSPERSDDRAFPVYGSNGLIGWANETNSPANSIVIGRVGSYCGSVHFSESACWVTDNAIRATAKGDNDPSFLYYLLKQLDLNNWRSGSGQPLINQSTLNSIDVSVPAPFSQRLIGSFISCLDDRITLLRETNATLEAIAQALFKSWFVDFDPVRAKVEGRQPEGMDAATAALFPNSFEESELGLVPRGWKAEIAEQWLSALETGRRPKGGVSGILDGVPSIGAESIVRIGEFDYSKTKYVSAEFFEKMKAGALQSHDVLLYKDGGKPGVFLPRVSMFGEGFPFRVCGINEHVFRVRLKYPFSQTFLYYWLWSDSVMHELKHRGGKAAIPGINQSDVKELKLLVPSEQTLNRFDEITKPLISKIFENSKKAQVLTQLRDSLLPRLISGQLRLLEAEAEAEAEALAAGDT
ncbi:restriction endonuclease subunit S [Pseudomonas aeruginosa]|uniref:restriction endonuclease subunit S n=1 Tax=Pseudomonas aeruginosa TaxID=287 RepID=UPI0034D1CDEB